MQEDERGTYIMNSKDLNLMDYVAELDNAGVCSFKIEGRMKSEYYLATVVNAYRRAIDDYYANGNSVIKYKHNATTTAAEWWLRSVDTRNGTNFRCISSTGGVNGRASNVSYGFAPAFMVA